MKEPALGGLCHLKKNLLECASFEDLLQIHMKSVSSVEVK